MKQYIKLTLIAILICLQGCETSVDKTDLLDQEELIIINGYLSPQESKLQVYVSKSKSIFGEDISNSADDLVIVNALVTISDEDDNEVMLSYIEESSSYEAAAADMKIIPGKKYFLAVVVNDETYKASCTIPKEKVGAIGYVVEEFNDKDDRNKNRRIKVTFDDIKNVDNYYVIGADITIEFNVLEDENTTILEAIDFDNDAFATDVNRTNTIITAEGFFSTFSNSPPDQSVFINVTNTEKILFDALKATYLNDFNNSNPFVEPVILPSNISGKNGFGVFAGYQSYKIQGSF